MRTRWLIWTCLIAWPAMPAAALSPAPTMGVYCAPDAPSTTPTVCGSSEAPCSLTFTAATAAPMVLELTKRVRVEFNPIGVAVTADGAFIYTANSGSNSVSKVDAKNLNLLANIPMDVSPAWLAAASDLGLVCVTAREAHSLILLDMASDFVQARIDLPYSPEQITVDQKTGRAYITTTRAPFIMVVDLKRRRLIQNISLTGASGGIDITPDGKLLYVTTLSDRYNLSVISAENGQMLARTNAGSNPTAVAVDPLGQYVYVANYDSNDLTVIYVPDHHKVATIPVGQGPVDLAFSPGGVLYVTCRIDASVSVVDTLRLRVATTLTLDVVPWGLAVSPDGRRIYAANYEVKGAVNALDASRVNAALGTGAASRVNNNNLLVISTGDLR